jgi:hypothetical protein
MKPPSIPLEIWSDNAGTVWMGDGYHAVVGKATGRPTSVRVNGPDLVAIGKAIAALPQVLAALHRAYVKANRAVANYLKANPEATEDSDGYLRILNVSLDKYQSALLAAGYTTEPATVTP